MSDRPKTVEGLARQAIINIDFSDDDYDEIQREQAIINISKALLSFAASEAAPLVESLKDLLYLAKAAGWHDELPTIKMAKEAIQSFKSKYPSGGKRE